MSQVTTHILDTSSGKPAAGITCILSGNENGSWKEIARGITNADGRIMDLLGQDIRLPEGTYCMRFETGAYHREKQTASFYPYVEIAFGISAGEHYHIPLLLSPFGYSTYRGS